VEEIVRLRGHHLLCLLGFRGLGYSPEFVENMTAVHSRVFAGGCGLEIVAGPDDICSACPRLVDGQCTAVEISRVGKKDAAVLALLSLRPGDRIEAREVYRRISEALTAEDLQRICRRCHWRSLGYCAEGLLELRRKGRPSDGEEDGA
jgi:hypothetical protein